MLVVGNEDYNEVNRNEQGLLLCWNSLFVQPGTEAQ